MDFTKFILLTLVLLNSFTSKVIRQNLNETKSWLLEKLNKYNTPYHNWEEKANEFDHKIKIIRDTVIFSYKKIVTKYEPDGNNRLIHSDRKVTIALVDLKDILVYDVVHNSDSADTPSRITFKTKFKTIHEQNLTNKTERPLFRHDLTIGFDFEREDNMLIRMRKGFAKLLSFYKNNPHKKETF